MPTPATASSAVAADAASSSAAAAAPPASERVLSLATLNPRLVKAEYAVRGEIVIRADALRKQLTAASAAAVPAAAAAGVSAPVSPLPFSSIVSCNIGNPHELGQQPLSFNRAVLSLCMCPHLLASAEKPEFRGLFKEDAIARAKKYLVSISGGLGAYSNSKGVSVVREEVAAFIQQRDGYPAVVDDLFLTDGASSGVKMLIQALIRKHSDGIMVPIPQYPLYSATLALTGGSLVGYELDESRQWAMDVRELERALAAAVAKKKNVRALVVINPGNPTGNCLTYENIKQVIEFCAKHRLVLMADEVYQSNIYGHTPFVSMKKVLRDMGDAYKNFELVSYHSVSKGFLGECGQRGGYMELCGFADEVKAQLYKMASISLCSNLPGQIMTGLMVNPPREGDASYQEYVSERDAILSSLKRRATKVAEAMNSIPGISCNPVQGALYAFPRVVLPAAFVAQARAQNKAPDAVYAMRLLERTGIVVVPGAGFGQANGTFHFRTTILPPERMMDDVLARFKAFHLALLKEYSDASPNVAVKLAQELPQPSQPQQQRHAVA